MALGRELPPSFEEALRTARRLLSQSPELMARGVIETEAEEIVRRAVTPALGSRAELFLRSRDRFPEDAGERVVVWAQARAAGKPLEHLTRSRQFLDHVYEVGPEVLIPRPETEVLARAAMERLEASKPALGLEIGLGSGVLSIELLSRFPGLRMLATELSSRARGLARRNAERILGSSGGSSGGALRILEPAGPLDVIETLAGELSRSGFAGADFLISNPPYLAGVAEAEKEVLENEPHEALFASHPDPSFFYSEIARKGAALLKAEGWLFLELPHERAELIGEMFRDRGWSGVEILKDLAGRGRVLVARGVCPAGVSGGVWGEYG